MRAPLVLATLLVLAAMLASGCAATIDAAQLDGAIHSGTTISYTGVRAASRFPDYSGIDASILREPP